MSKAYMTDKDSGRMIYYGNESNPKMATLIAAGHKKVTKSQPDNTRKWNGNAWVADPGLVKDRANLLAMRKRHREYPPRQDQLDAALAGGQAAIDMKSLVDAVNTANPIT